MELPVTTPISRRPGIVGTNGILNYGEMCHLNAGFARSSRIARHRLALYGEQSLFEIKEIHDKCQQDAPTEEPGPDHISETKSLPYISSSSTLDNTTISASITLESHSVYSTPPLSMILHTPVITVTGPAEQDFEDESAQDGGSDSQSSDGEKFRYQSPNSIRATTEQDGLSTGAPAPILGKLARRRGFQGLPIITSFPPSHTLLSPLSIIFQASCSRRSPDHSSSETTSPTTIDTTSLFSPRSVVFTSQRSSSTDLSTPCDEADPFATHGDSFYSTDFFQSGEDVNDLTIYTLGEKTRDNENPLFIRHDKPDVNWNILGPANGRTLITNIYDISAYVSEEGLLPKRRKTRPKSLTRSHLCSPLSIDIASSNATHSCLTSGVEVSLEGSCRTSVSTLGKPDVINSVAISRARSPPKQARRSTMVVTDGILTNFVGLTNQSEDMDVGSHKHFSFPYYPFREGGQGWCDGARSTSVINEASKSVSGVSSISCSGSGENTDPTLLPRDIVPINGLCVPTPDVIPQLDDDLFRSFDLSFDDFGSLSGTNTAVMASKFDNIFRSPAESSHIPATIALSVCGRRTESASFFGQGPDIQAWISVVNSSLSSAVSSGPDDLLAAVDSFSTYRDETKRNVTGLQVSMDQAHLASRRPKSLGSIPACTQEITLGNRHSSVIYTRERRTFDISALSPLVLPVHLTFWNSLESNSDTDPIRNDLERGPSSSFVDIGDTTASKTPTYDHNSSSKATSHGRFGDLLEALHLCSIADNLSDRSPSHYLSTTAIDIEESDKNNLTSDTTVSCGIAL